MRSQACGAFLAYVLAEGVASRFSHKTLSSLSGVFMFSETSVRENPSTIFLAADWSHGARVPLDIEILPPKNVTVGSRRG